MRFCFFLPTLLEFNIDKSCYVIVGTADLHTVMIYQNSQLLIFYKAFKIIACILQLCLIWTDFMSIALTTELQILIMKLLLSDIK